MKLKKRKKKITINIPLIDGWRILSDNNQYILAKEEGKRISHESFHIEIEKAVQEFVSKKIKGFDSKSILSLLEAIKSLETRLNKALRPLKLRIVRENG